jgi:cytochrome b6-f complex iron-sulfur subunit
MRESGAQAAVPRRGVLCGALLLGAVGAGGLAGCSSGSADGGSANGGGPGDGGTSPGTAAASGSVLTPLADVPVGSGTVVRMPDGTAVIVVQPEQGTVKAFDARCTHRGSQVQPPDDGVMTCPSHNSQFRATDGGVVQGPATRPLTEIKVTLTDGNVTLA